MKINNILITGSRGFVGKHLCESLSDIGSYAILDDKFNIDVRDLSQVKSIRNVGDVEAVVHLAAKTSVIASFDDPYEAYHTNLIGTLNLLELSRLKDISKFIYVSSYVYGKPQYLPIDEKHPTSPHSPYNKSKLLAEGLCKSYSSDFGFDVVTLRPFYLYGPKSNYFSFIPSAIRQIQKGNVVVLSGESTKRDFLFISDFVRLIELILTHFPRGYNLYNVGYGTSNTLEEITQLIAKMLKKQRLTISYDSSIRPNDITEMTADISKVSEAFNWKPAVDIDKGLKLTVENAISNSNRLSL